MNPIIVLMSFSDQPLSPVEPAFIVFIISMYFISISGLCSRLI